MAITTKLTSLIPASERLKREIELISGGYSLRAYLPDSHLTVYPWDSEVSDWVVNNSRITDDAFSAAIVAKLTRLPIDTVNNFIASELVMIMLVARSLVTDGKLTYTARCPHCNEVQKPSSIQVPGQLGVIGKKAYDYAGTDTITLGECGDVLAVRPLRVCDVMAVNAENIPGGLSKAGRRNAAAIVSVNGTTPDALAELIKYYRALPPADSDLLAAKLTNEVNPALDTLIPHECDECGQPFKFNLALNFDFFLPSLR